jgi:hypothetical protein
VGGQLGQLGGPHAVQLGVEGVDGPLVLVRQLVAAPRGVAAL